MTQILNISYHNYQHANQTLRRATPISIRNTSSADFVTTLSVLMIHSQQPVSFVKEFNDDDVAQIFIDTLENNIKDIYKKFKFPKNMIITRHDKLVYDNSNCHICNEKLSEDRVCNHCHLSGKFRGTAHGVCNLKYKLPMISQLYFTICLATTVTYLLKH